MKKVNSSKVNWEVLVRTFDPEYKNFRPVVYYFGGRKDSKAGQKLDPIVPGPYRD